MAPDEPTTDWYPPPPPPPPAAPPARRLERSRRDRKIAGVCGGLGDYFDIDPVIFRIGFVVLTIAGGSGILLYIAGMIFVPEEGRRRSIGESLPRHGRPLFPVILLGIGFLMLWGQMFDRHGGGFGFGFTLLAIGGFLLWRRSQRHDDWHRDDDLPPAPGDLYPPMWNPPAPDDMYPPRWNPPAPSETTSTSAPATSHPSTPSEFDGLDPFDGKPRDPDPTAAYTTAHEQAFAALPPEPEIWPPLDYQPPALPQRPSMTPVVVSFLFVVGGIAALLSTTNTLDITAGEFLAGALIATGLALVINAVRGGRSRGLIALGILLTIALSIASVAREPLRGGIGQRDWNPATLSQVERPYRLGIGEGDLDLTHLTNLHGKHVIAARIGLGQLKVIVPRDANVIAKGDVGVGQVRLFDQSRDNGNHLTVLDPPAANSDQPTLELHLHVDVGQVEVLRAAA
ncbi:MAG TPA: PspC domain-containing protein [Acidimicrobiales bacterium]|nr:PspC domain-containing protein [Acidimicrobiales bacterium]